MVDCTLSVVFRHNVPRVYVFSPVAVSRFTATRLPPTKRVREAAPTVNSVGCGVDVIQLIKLKVDPTPQTSDR